MPHHSKTASVHPAEPLVLPVHRPSMLRSRWMQTVGGILYLILTLVASWRFLQSSSQSLANDFFWVDFNATGSGMYIAHAFNTMLQRPNHMPQLSMRLDAPALVWDKRMATATNLLSFPAMAARMVQYHRLTRVQDGIQGIRQSTVSRVLWMFTQYCWVDFDRRWSLAHTAARADRCQRQYAANGAVYLESILRNVDWPTFLELWGPQFVSAIGDPLRSLTGGSEFLESLATHTPLPLDHEAAYWQHKGITHFQLQFHNTVQLGITEKIHIINAFGLKAAWTIKQSEYGLRYGAQTTYKMSWGFQNDLWAAAESATKIMGTSLVREAAGFYESGPHAVTMEQVMADDGLFPTPLTSHDALWRDAVGPFGSIDMFWTMYPPTLFELLYVVSHAIGTTILTDSSAATTYFDIPTISSWNTQPMMWKTHDWMFTGGSPLCSTPLPVAYVQAPFDFYATCGTPTQNTAINTRQSLVFAYLTSLPPTQHLNITDDVLDQLCRSGTEELVACTTLIRQTEAFVTQFVRLEQRTAIYALAQRTMPEILAMNVSLMQFVTTASDHKLLLEPLVGGSWHPFFGWLYLFEWVHGDREVVSFQGDHGTLTLLSAVLIRMAPAANIAEIPQSMSHYFDLGVQYVTCVLVLIAIMALWYTLASRGHIAGLNFLDFNRVSGTVWVGRPLLLLRGLVAICILSTSRLTPMTMTYGPQQFVSTMVESPVPIWQSILNAGEAGWLVFVANDMLLVWTQGLTYQYAMVCNVLVWLVVALIQLISPIQHQAFVSPDCEFVALDRHVSCVSGAVSIGNSQRFIEIVSVTLGTLVVGYILVRLVCTPRPTPDGAVFVLPGIAQHVFTTDGWTHEGEWYMDAASAAIAGLLTIRFGKISYVLDVKSWSIARLRDGQMISTNHDITHEDRTTTRTGRPPHLHHAIHVTTQYMTTCKHH